MTIQTLYPDIKPTLNLDFANTEKLDPRITFARASSARYYNGVTTTKAEQNLFLYSQEFDNAYWEKSALTVTANTGDTVAPDGTTTAEKITDTTSDASHLMQTASGVPAILANTNYVFSCFIKNSDVQYVDLVLRGTTSNYAGAEFDLVAGTATSFQLGTGYTATATISSVGNSWYRCVVFVTLGANVSAFRTYIATSDGTTARSTSGLRPYVGTEKSAYIWGAQLEQRSSVTAYTPTTTQPITNYIPTLLTATDNVARFDHNPTTGESLGLLVEEQRTNLLLRSEEFDNASWTKIRASITANTIVAPDGALTGDAVIPTAVSGTHIANQAVSVTAQTYTISAYAKFGGYNFLQLNIPDPGAGGAGKVGSFNLSTGALGAVQDPGVTRTITPVGNGWYRCTVTFTITGAGSSECAVLVTQTDVRAETYTGNGYSGIYIWGAQLEAGAFATSYIPTVASQVTRSADAASMTGANFSSWYRADEGTLYYEGLLGALMSSGSFGQLFDMRTSFADRMSLYWNPTNTNNVGFFVQYANSTQVTTASSLNAGIAFKLSGAYKANDFASSLNGASAATDSVGVVPVINAAYFGNGGGTVLGQQYIRKLSYYPKRLTNAQLQAITG